MSQSFLRKGLDKPLRFQHRLVTALFLLHVCTTALAENVSTDLRCASDDVGQQICLQAIPHRVVSLAPNLTETLFFLGASDTLVGRTARCNRPAGAAKIPQIGPYLHPDLERIISVKPELVLATKPGLREEIVERLNALNIRVFVEDCRSMDDLCSLLRRLGVLLGRKEAAETAANDIQHRRKILRERLQGLARPSVLFAVGVKPLVVAGGQSFLGSLIREAGGTNIAEDLPISYTRYSLEEVLKKDPEYILILDKECKQQECVDHLKRYAALSAVQYHKVASLDADLVARPAPGVIEALELIAKTLHPTAEKMSASGREHR